MKPSRLAFLLFLLTMSLGFGPATLIAQETSEPKVQQTEKPDENIIRVYRLRFTSAETAAQVVGSLFSDSKSQTSRLSVDAATNSIIVSASEAFHKEILDLLNMVDQEETVASKPTSSASRPVNFMVQMIMDSDQGDWSANAVSPNADVIEILKSVQEDGLFQPFKDPRVVASSIVRVNPRSLSNEASRRMASYMTSGKVFAESSSSQNTGKFALNGMLTLGADNEYFLGCELKIELLAPAPDGQPPENRKVLTTRIESESTMAKLHPVLLSVNSIEGRNCAIILEIR